MRKLLLLITILPLWMSADMSSPVLDNNMGVQFFKGTLDAAKEKARREGKLVFVDFYANWCSPCRIMDEYTFIDGDLARYMSDKYVPVKVNIDDFDGFALKQQYNIRLLPTLLIMNCDGKEVERKEEGLSISKMRTFLGTHYQPYNLCDIPPAAPITSPPPAAPSTPSEPSTAPTPRPEPMKPVVPKPTINPSQPNSASTPTVPKPNTPSLIEPATPESVASNPPPSMPSLPAANTRPPIEERLFRFSVQKQNSKGYSVQTGAFGQYGNVLREVDKLQILYPSQPIIVYISSLNNRTIYKVLVGEFQTKREAVQHKNKMGNRGLPGLVKNLALMR